VRVGLLGSVWSLVLFYAGLQVPFTTVLYVGFLRALLWNDFPLLYLMTPHGQRTTISGKVVWGARYLSLPSRPRSQPRLTAPPT
jgi:hypothetical protein